MSGVQTRVIGPDDGDQRLDRYLRRLFPDVTQGRIEKMCRKGEVRSCEVPRMQYREKVPHPLRDKEWFSLHGSQDC